MQLITDVLDCGNDVLLVRASLDGSDYEATGWVSATTNHFDADAYDDDGNLKPDATARAMTSAEVGEYALALILAASPELAARVANPPVAMPPAPAPVDFTAPDVDLTPAAS